MWPVEDTADQIEKIERESWTFKGAELAVRATQTPSGLWSNVVRAKDFCYCWPWQELIWLWWSADLSCSTAQGLHAFLQICNNAIGTHQDLMHTRVKESKKSIRTPRQSFCHGKIFFFCDRKRLFSVACGVKSGREDLCCRGFDFFCFRPPIILRFHESRGVLLPRHGR